MSLYKINITVNRDDVDIEPGRFVTTSSGDVLGMSLGNGKIMTRGIVGNTHVSKGISLKDLSYQQEYEYKFPEPINNMAWSKDRKEIGKIDWDSGKLIFTGNADEAAIVFFNDFLKHYVDLYINYKLNEGKK